MITWIKQSLFRKILVALLALSVIGAGTTWYILSTQDKKSETPVVKEKATLTIESEPEGVTMTLDENCKSDSSESVTPFNCTFSAEKKDTIVTAPEEFEKDGQKYTFSTWDGCSEGNENKRICKVDNEGKKIKATYEKVEILKSQNNLKVGNKENEQTERKLSISPGYGQLNPQIWGDFVVFKEYSLSSQPSSEKNRIVLFNTRTKEKKIVKNSPNNLSAPVIHGGLIAWVDAGNVYLAKIEDLTPIKIGSTTNDKIMIDNEYVLWYKVKAYYTLFSYNVSTKIIKELQVGGNPSVNNGKLAYSRNYEKEIWIYDLKTDAESLAKKVNVDSATLIPIISRNLIFWRYAGGNTYNLDTKETKRNGINIYNPVFHNSNDELFHLRNKDNIYDYRTLDIFRYNIEDQKNVMITNSNTLKRNLSVYDNTAVWADYRETPAIYTIKFK